MIILIIKTIIFIKSDKIGEHIYFHVIHTLEEALHCVISLG
jgi:hypothetical protein